MRSVLYARFGIDATATCLGLAMRVALLPSPPRAGMFEPSDRVSEVSSSLFIPIWHSMALHLLWGDGGKDALSERLERLFSRQPRGSSTLLRSPPVFYFFLIVFLPSTGSRYSWVPSVYTICESSVFVFVLHPLIPDTPRSSSV